MNLRPFQIIAAERVLSIWKLVKRLLLILPTGTGKTIVFSKIVEARVREGDRVLILAHRRELLDQAREKLRLATGLSASLEQGENHSRGELEAVTIGSVQTLSRPDRLRLFDPRTFGTIIIDEAHHALSDSYLRILEHFASARILGVTATPDRGDLRDLGEVFERVAYEYTLPEAIRDGYLSRIFSQTLPIRIDLSSIPKRKSGGDIREEELGGVLSHYLPEIAREWKRLASDRKGIIFTPLCVTGIELREELRKIGAPAFFCSGEDRSELAAFEAAPPGAVICNAMLLTEGYDHPRVDAIMVLRATKVRSLYAQMIGRGTRICEGKKDLLVLDPLWLGDSFDLCHPAHLRAESSEVAAKVSAKLEAAAAKGGGLELTEELFEEAEAEVCRDREEAVAKRLAEVRARKGRLLEPILFGSLCGSTTAEADPILGEDLRRERSKATRDQIDALEAIGIRGDLSSFSEAEAILCQIESRKARGLATPKQVRKLDQIGIRNAGSRTRLEANRILSQVAANGWRVPSSLLIRENSLLEAVGGGKL